MPEAAMNPTQLSYILELAEKLRSAKHGEKGGLVREAAAFLARHEVVVYRWLREVDVDGKERKTRSDAGASKLTEEGLRVVAGLVRGGTRLNGKEAITLQGAVEMAKGNGRIPADVSVSTVSRQLYLRGMHPEQLKRATPHSSMASRHPNHVWQIDTSLCVLFYLETDRLGVMDEKKFYKNKMDNIYKIKDKRVLRVAIADHYSGSFYLRYLLGGESLENLVTALTEAVMPREGDPFCGVPRLLGMDPGMANKSRGMKVFLRNLGIDPLVHRVANSRANGTVESNHNIIEINFEGRLKLWPEKIDSLETLNREATKWRLHYCGRATHSRHGRTRQAMWATITDEQKRVPASLALVREAATSEPKQATVYGDYSIKVDGHDYDVRHIPEAAVNGTLLVSTNVFRSPGLINIHAGDGKIWLAEKIEKDDAGFRVGAAMWGESYKSPPDGLVDKQRKAIDQEMWGPEGERRRGGRQVPFGGAIDPMADVGAAPPVEVAAGVAHAVAVPEVVWPPRRAAAPAEPSEAELAAAARHLERGKPKLVLLDAVGRPAMEDDVSWIQWLSENPDMVLPEDKTYLKNKLRNPASRALLEASGVLETARQLVA